jgi:hypothetical protein
MVCGTYGLTHAASISRTGLSFTLQSHIMVNLPFFSNTMCRDLENVLLHDLVIALDCQEHCIVKRHFFQLRNATAAKGQLFCRFDELEHLGVQE